MTSVAPDAALTSPTNNWGVYYTYAVQCVLDGKQSTQTGAKDSLRMQSESLRSMRLLQQKEQNAKVEEVEAALKDGSLHVFDTSTFTVNGSSLEDLIAEGGDYAKYADYVFRRLLS